MAQVQYVVPRIVEDNLVAPDDTLPTTSALQNQLISKASMAGALDEGELQAPLAEKGLGGARLLVPAAEDTTVYFTVSNPAAFPGGTTAWARYLLRHLRYPEEAIEQEIEAAVTVHFVVNKQGKISEVRAANDPGYGLADEAVRIISQGPDWLPAEQNGWKVNYRASQVIVFKLSR
jgi:protein TonB